MEETNDATERVRRIKLDTSAPILRMETTNDATERVRRIKLDTSALILPMGATVEEGPDDKTQNLIAPHKGILPQTHVEKEPDTNGQVHTSPATAKALPALQMPHHPDKPSRRVSKRLADGAYVRTIQERCRQVCL